MIKLRLLQLGDIHLGTSHDKGMDQTDRRFPAHLASQLSSDPLAGALRMVVHLLEKTTVDGILLAGDFCNKGDLVTYEQCVEQLVKLFLGKWHQNNRPAFCVPGNHDIDRKKIQINPSVDRMWDKFAPLEAAWDKHQVPILAVRDVKTFTVVKGAAKAEIIALNSCLGCGEYYGMPDELQEAARNWVDKTADPERKWDAIEQIDSPAFARPHLEATSGMLDATDRVNVVLAHHNLLPQALPRVAPFAELSNGGQFRNMFARARSPSLYCHGHIHDDPVEVLSVPPRRTAALVAISAPQLHEGFNVLELTYMDSGVPLGVTVQKFRPDRARMFSQRPNEEIRVPFRSNADYFPFFSEPRSTVLSALRTFGNAGARFPELQGKVNCQTLSATELADLLLEAEWYGLVSIRDREQPPEYWQISPDSP